MSFSLPITIILAAVMMVSSALDKKFNPQPVITIQEEVIAYAEPLDTTEIVPQVILITAAEEGSGFRVQIFSTESEEKAVELVERVKFLLPYNTHIHFEDGSYKVRVGDFIYKNEADAAAEEIRLGEFDDSWVVECPISLSQDGFRIQLAAMNSPFNASTYAKLVESDMNIPIHVVKENDIWKVRVGDFISKAEAEDFKTRLNEMGYSEVWVVLDRVYP